MGLLDTWQEWKNRYSQNKEDRESLQIAGGRPGLRIGMQGYQAPDNAYTGLAPDQKDRLGRITQEGTYNQAPVSKEGFQTRFKKQVTLPDGTKRWMGPNEMVQKGFNVPTVTKKKDAPINTVYQDDIMRGGAGTKQGEDPSWWQGLANKFNSKFNMDDAVANWKEKGGFEGLMANPAFTMGLAFMQSAAEGKTLGAGALDNVMKAGGISQHYKQIIKDRKQAPIQATAADMAEVEGMLKSMDIEEGNWLENLISKAQGGNPGLEWSGAVEEIAVQYQAEVQKWQANNKNADGTPKIIRQSDKIKIMNKLVKSGKIKKKKSWTGGFLTSGTLSMPVPKAQGGPVQAGKPYVVGEKGPEVVVPKADANVVSNDDSQVMGMLLASNPQLQNVSRPRAESILRSRFPDYFA